MRHNEQALASLGRAMHQDIDVGVSDSEGLVAAALALVPVSDRPELQAYLEKALVDLTPSELKGALNRTESAWGFSSKGAEQFLRAVLEELRDG